jgi:hypothetical protein
MPRISKGPRLYKRKAKRRNGRLIANAVWTIRDGTESCHKVSAGRLGEAAQAAGPRKVYHFSTPASRPRY